jgi:hypothetical protein
MRKAPNKAIITMKVARPNICLSNFFSLGKNISPVAKEDMNKIPSEDGIPMKGEVNVMEFNRITPENTTRSIILINAHLSALGMLLLFALFTFDLL